jgi:hypothetical protein
MKNLIKGKATKIPITQIIGHHNQTLSKINEGYKNILSNLPAAPFTPYVSRKKRFLDLLFGIAGTAFGVANRIEINKINSLIVKNMMFYLALKTKLIKLQLTTVSFLTFQK